MIRLSDFNPWSREGAGSLLPAAPDGDRGAVLIVAMLCFLACLSGIGALAADRAAHGWGRQLRAEATVQVRPRVGESGTTAAARAAETLAGVDGVAEAQALDRETAEALLRPWLGDAIPADLPLPFLVTVQLAPDAPASAPTLSRALAAAGLDASVDDHSLWRSGIERSAAAAGGLAVLALLLTAIAAAAVITHVTRAGMVTLRPVTETLRLAGIDETRLTGLFQRRYGLLAFAGGLIGTLAAACVLSAVRLLGGTEGLTPALPIVWRDLVWLSPTPLLAATVALVVTRFFTGLATGRVPVRV